MSFALPKCWDNDETMNFRFQPFGDRASNPLGYDTKMKFWKELILEVSRSGDGDMTISITYDMLCNSFNRKGKTPKCLATVLENLRREGLLTEYQTYRDNLAEVVQRQQATWSSWSYQVLVSSPLKKVASKVVSVVSPKRITTESERYVVHGNVKQRAQKLLEWVRQRADTTHVGAGFRLILSHKDLLAIPGLDAQHIDLLLLWLESEKCVTSIASESLGTVYKFSAKSDKRLESLTEVEQGVLEIQHAKDKLENSVASRQQQVDKQIIEIKSQLAKKNQPLALRALRKKKALEKNIDKEEEHIQKLDCTLNEIYMSSTNQLVLQAYSKGAATLKSLTDQTPVDAVNTAMDNLSEGLAASNDISGALSPPLPGDDNDTESLEQELAELLAEDHPLVNDTKVKQLVKDVDSLTVGNVVSKKSTKQALAS